MSKNFSYLVVTLALVLTFGTFANAALLPQTVPQGGTGWGNLEANTLLTGNGTTRIATTTVGSGLSLAGGVLTATGGGTGTVSTSSPLTSGQPIYATGWNTIASVASSTFLTSIGGQPAGDYAPFAWTPTTNYGVAVNATSTPIWFQQGLMASSTSYFTNVFTTNATTTNLSAHTVYSDASDGLILNSASGLNVANFGLANSQNSLFYGGVNIDGATRLATSLTGLLKATSGAITTATAGVDYENPLTFSFPLIRSTNAISWGGLATSTDAVVGNIPYFTGVNTFGNVATSTLGVGASITSSGTLGYQIGGTASSLSLNMANANTWTALQTFGNASTTQIGSTGSAYFATAGGNVGIGTTSPAQLFSVGNGVASGGLYYSAVGLSVGSSTPAYPFSVSDTFYINSVGRVVAKDTTNGWSGVLSPTHTMGFQIATSTATWTATSTAGVDISSPRVMTYAGTIRSVRCKVNTFLGVNLQINGSSVAPAYFVASTTSGVINLTGSNTFSAGDYIGASVGTTTSATAASGVVNGSCTISVTETP